MIARRHAAWLLFTASLAACAAPGPTVSAPGGSGSPPAAAPTAPPSAVALPASSPAPTASPTPVAVPSAAALPSLAAGTVLRRYDFKGIGGLHVEPASDALHVIDAVNDDVTPRRYMLRRFKRDGTFEVAVGLALEGEKAPDAVEGYAFGAFGTPFYTYREDERLVLRRLFTATPRDAADVPGYATARAAMAALRVDGTVVTLATLRLDPDEKAAKTTNMRFVTYVQGDPERDPGAVFQVADPFVPTRRMALGPDGRLYLFGATTGGQLGVKRLDAAQQLVDLPIALSRMPDLVTFDPAGRLWLAYNTTGSEPATVAVHDPSGALVGTLPVTLADGAKVFQVRGLAFDRAGIPLIGGSAITSDLRTVHGIFEFRPPNP